MNRRVRTAAAIAVAMTAFQAGSARAQYGPYTYPGGYGGYGWGGWGGGSTVQGDMARGLGVYAAGAGAYNYKTSVANAINANTVANWNQYMYLSQMQANTLQRQRLARRQNLTSKTLDDRQKRLRDNPTPRDIAQGDALNVAFDEINDPRIYSRTLSEAKVKLGGDTIRDIPFQYAAAAISVSVHQITQGGPPPSLMTEEFATDRATIKGLGTQIRKEIEEKGTPDPETIAKALAAVNATEARAESLLPKNTRGRTEADKYLKALHGLITMMQTPAFDVLLSGAEKRPDATLGELLNFMNSFNFRFGPATTVRQREVYTKLYPELARLRTAIAPALAKAEAAKPQGTEPREFFTGMSHDDLEKKAPAPPAPGNAPR